VLCAAPQAPLEGVDPDEVVALGCAVQAAALAGQLPRGDAILLDETPDCQDFAALLERMHGTLDGAAGGGGRSERGGGAAAAGRSAAAGALRARRRALLATPRPARGGAAAGTARGGCFPAASCAFFCVR
jgi:hypothetical protein